MARRSREAGGIGRPVRRSMVHENRPAIVARTSKITIVDVVKTLELIVTESNASKLIDALG